VSPGCVDTVIILAIIAGVPVTIIALFVHGARSTARAQAAELATRRDRGERITNLLVDLEVDESNAEVQGELYKLLHEPPVGYVQELTASGGWFERVSPVLRRLTNTDAGTKVVGAYFRSFVFPSGQQAAALAFLADFLNDSAADAKRLAFFEKAASGVVETSSQPEARWLYDQALAHVRMHRGAPSTKAVALTIGRLSYSAGRPNRQPTVYDEQAISNDIAAQLP
jgi:hypothetical protein